MKRLKFFALILFVITLTNSQSLYAQAEVIFDQTFVLLIPHPDRNSERVAVPSSSARTTISASGNIVKVAKFKLPEGNFLIPEKGVKSIAVAIKKYDEDGNIVGYLRDPDVKIRKSGELKVVLHND